MSSTIVEYPEHEKIQALAGDNDTIGAFLEWLSEEGYVIARYGAPYELAAHVNTRRFSMRQAREWEEVHATRDPIRIGEWLEAEELHGEIEWRALPSLFGLDFVLPDPDQPELDWYVTFTDAHNLWPAGEGIERLLARYFDVDLRKLADEKTEMLAAIRAT